MANKKYEETDIQAIAEAIREKTGSEDSYKVSDMASGVNEVYEAGKKTEYDAFWDVYLAHFNNTGVLDGSFAGRGWTDNTFNPPSGTWVVRSGQMMFWNCTITDLVELCRKIGLTLDFSECYNCQNMFAFSAITHIGKLDLNNIYLSSTHGLFNQCKKLHTIDELACKADIIYNNFDACESLENIIISGTIGKTISFSYSPLSVESMKSIITHLKDYSGTTSEYTYTVTFKTSAFEVLEAEGATAEYNGVACTWAELIDNLKWNLVKA